MTNEGAAERPALLIDSHCHLDQPQFDVDRAEVIARAAAAGVGLIVNPATDLESCERVLGLADRYPAVYAAVGVHPNDCAGFSVESVRALRKLAQHPKVVAVGEIGLDYYWKRVPVEQQKLALRAQLELAGELGLPVILHSRESNADLLWELAQWVRTVPNEKAERGMLGVLHAFSGDLANAQVAYALGFLLSLGGPVTFQNARQLRTMVPQLRLDRLMLETDAPYLAPHPIRGQRNEPAHLSLIAQSLAALLGVSSESLAVETSQTARGFFNLSQTGRVVD